jgi:8-oxo-dGTP pyrophosphatase MutT (NUDIX family)
VTDLHDDEVPARTRSSRVAFDGAVWSVRTDVVDLGMHGVVERDVLVHPGAVAVAALDDQRRLVLVRQYRHPVASMLWELPAGMLDAAGESMLRTAQRELAEEVGLQAIRWDTLVDLYKSSGGSTERMRIYLARDLSAVDPEPGFVRQHEEAELAVDRVPLDDVVAAALDGQVHNAALVAGALALHAVPLAGGQGLRPADAPWRGREGLGIG